MILYTALNGYIDDIPLAKVIAFETDFHRFMEANHPEIGKNIAKEKDITAETEETLKAAILECKQGFLV
jgi:F-type H+-transporting ATPase subunit alpha